MVSQKNEVSYNLSNHMKNVQKKRAETMTNKVDIRAKQRKPVKESSFIERRPGSS
jgi:hypothetical protein